MDLQLVERENRIIGQEFLTWLWYYSEVRHGTFTDAKGNGFALYMDQRVSVQGGEGENLATATVSNPIGDLTEALSGLRVGKKVNKAQIKFENDVDSWMVTLKAEDFAMTGLKTPKVESSKDDEDGEGEFLEKISLIEDCLNMLDVAFAEYLGRRLGSDWAEEAKAIHEWMVGR